MRDGGDIDDSHPRAERVAPSGSHRRRLSGHAQIRAPCTIPHRGSKSASKWIIDYKDGLVDVQETVQDDMQMVTGVPHPIETEVPHTSEMAEVPHLSEEEATTTIEVTPKTFIKAPTPHTTIEAPITINDMEVTPLVETNVTYSHETCVTAPHETNITTSASTYSFCTRG